MNNYKLIKWIAGYVAHIFICIQFLQFLSKQKLIFYKHYIKLARNPALPGS